MRSRNVLLLTICQALASSAGPLVTLVGGIIGTTLAPNPAWATLPMTMMIIGVTCFTIPAAMLMKRIGRKYGFIFATSMATFAALSAAYALSVHSFTLFCLGTLFIGGTNSFVGQFRFAAGESVPQPQASRAISFLLFGGIIAGFLGPQLGKMTANLIPSGAYVGSFVALAGVYVLVTIILLFLRPIQIRNPGVKGVERPLREIIVQPTYYVAVLAGVIAYGVMSFIMTATPIAMHVMDGYSMDSTTTVIQSHVIAMFVPSLFAGFLIERFGAPRVMVAGIVSLVLCILMATSSHLWSHYWVALVLLGVGWNFMYVGATILLTHTYRSTERFKAQALNDFSVFGMQAISSLTAGTVIHLTNWSNLVLLPLPLLAIMIVGLLALHRHQSRPVAGGAATA